ncbi:MAG: FAD binding domain-containing protein [Myxococcota bacterium]
MYSSLTAFAYHEPERLQQACTLLFECGPNARVVAGGCDLLPAIRRRAVAPSALVSLARIPNLRGVQAGSAGLHILPMASLRAVEQCEPVRAKYTALFEGVHSIASVQVKTTGTLIGNVCVATPASDISPPLMVLGAELDILGPTGTRALPIDAVFAATKRTALERGEIVAAVRVPPPAPGTGSAFAKLTRTAADCAKINVAARVTLSGGRVNDVRIALGSVAAIPVRAPEAEASLAGGTLDDHAIEQAARLAVDNTQPITDVRSTAEYRQRTLHVLLRRVLADARDRALESQGSVTR